MLKIKKTWFENKNKINVGNKIFFFLKLANYIIQSTLVNPDTRVFCIFYPESETR